MVPQKKSSHLDRLLFLLVFRKGALGSASADLPSEPGPGFVWVMPGRPFHFVQESKRKPPSHLGSFCLGASLAPFLCPPLRHADAFLCAQPVLTLPGPCTVVRGGSQEAGLSLLPGVQSTGSDLLSRPHLVGSWRLPFSYACLHWYYFMVLTSTCPAHASFINPLSSY